MEEHQYLPDTNRLSILTAIILLAYALIPFIKLPETLVPIPFPGISFSFTWNYSTLVSYLVAALAAVGGNWLLRDHPNLQSRSALRHCILPALTAWGIGAPLRSLAVGMQWWAMFAFGGMLLVMVFVAEYIVVDNSDVRYAIATIGLTAVSFALYLILTVALRAADLRLYMVLPALVLAIGLVALRTLYLRLGGEWGLHWAIVIAIIVGQIVVGLHYWPLRPLRFGLLLIGPAYALTSVAGSLEEGRSLRTLWVEPVLMLILLWGLAFTLET